MCRPCYLLSYCASIFLITIFQSCSNDPKSATNESVNSLIYGNYWFGGELLAVDITPANVRFLINPQCDFVFKSKLYENELILYWPPENQCMTTEMLSLEFKGIETPNEGSVFAELQLAGDNKFYCKYKYQDWVDSINIVRGIYFPESLRVKFQKLQNQ